MVPESSLQHSQAPTTCPYPKPQQSSPCLPIPHPTSWRYILILSSHLCLGVPSSLSLRSPPPKPCMHLSCLQYVPHAPPISFFLFDHQNNVLWGLEIIKLLAMQSLWLYCYLVPLRPKCLPQYPILEHPQPMLSLSVTDRVSHPYKTTGRIVVLNILIIIFLDIKLEGKRFCTIW